MIDEEFSVNYKPIKTPNYFQMEYVECGAAALGIILAYYKRYIPLEQLREECGVTRDGSKAINIVRAAEKEGLKATGYKRSMDYVLKSKPPFIAYWENNHFVVVEGFKGNMAYVNDPAIGRISYTLDEFEKSYSGVVLCFEKTAEFAEQGQPDRITEQLLDRLSDEEANLKYILYFVLASAVLALVTPLFGKLFVDYYLIENLHSIIKVIIIGVIATSLLRFITSLMMNYYETKFQNKLSIVFTSNFLWKLLKSPFSLFAHRFVGDIAQRVGLNAMIATFMANNVVGVVADGILIIMYFLMMMYFNVEIGLITVILVTINAFILYKVSKIRRELSFKMSNKMSNYYSYGYGALRNIEAIKASGAEQDAFARVSGAEVEVANTIHTLDRKSLNYFLTPMVITSFNSTIVLILGAYKVMTGDMSIGTLVALQSIVAGFSMPLMKVSLLVTQMQEMAGSIAKCDDILHYEDPTARNFVEKKTLFDACGCVKSKLSGYIELHNVNYGYNKLEKPILRDISLVISPGEHVALVGISGSGKTTLTKLMSHLLIPWCGDILFDHENIKAIPSELMQNSLSLVEQQGFLFNCTIRDNITLWDERIHLKKIIQVAKETGIHDEISLRPHGYGEIILENGANFSGGQRQRFELARALISDPSILILDEATSELDVESEFKIIEFLKKRGCTIVTAAHRLSTIKDADRILVLKLGEIIATGTHDDLIRECEYYKNMMSID